MTDSRIVQVATSNNGVSTVVPCSSSTAIRVNTTDASPRGPNHPMNPVVSGRNPLPSSATATGSMRIKVRLSTA